MGDYYSVLGLTYGASKDEIKLAFRKLALQHHPDRHISSTKAQQEQAAVRFKAITEAYDVLTDDRKRAQYEASVRSGGGTTGSSYGNSGRYSYGYHSHNVNTDWAYSRYSHRDHARARISWFQQLQRVIGARKLEVGLTLAGVGLLLFCGPAVDAAWTARNQGLQRHASYKDGRLLFLRRCRRRCARWQQLCGPPRQRPRDSGAGWRQPPAEAIQSCGGLQPQA
ncbi:hypothetical protein Vretimale_14289 [Volvox reticuliferus]|uniref:J domain-containing protein n=1 Tax=Volvox reticuliferus TaxID=1737510 RepID=A0A8J4GNE0_9CHLO|nr:hypothetical protein Vretimale_14289 [Volvox reticuliferus]